MKVTVGVSVRHVHLTNEDYKLLFDEVIKEKSALNQIGQFAARQTVTIESGGKQIENVRIIGPCRKYTQVEISRTDAYTLKINPPINKSGDLTYAEKITIIGPKGKITRKACIIPERHIHITKQLRKEYGLTKEVYQVKKTGSKGGVLGNVKISESTDAFYELHLDSDDANALDIKQNEIVEIIEC